MRKAPILLSMFFLSLLAVRAQTTGAIAGSVMDPSGASVRGARLRVLETGTGAERTVLTDSLGHYEALGLAPGLYDITVAHPGFREETKKGLALGAGHTVRVNFALVLGESRSGIEVVGETPLVSTSPGDWGGSISQGQLATLPLNGRDLFELSVQQAGATIASTASRETNHGLGIKISVHGARPAQNSFQMDGIYINDAAASAPASAAGALLGAEGIRELRLVTTPFSAEYGRAAGAILTAVSRSGANELHGSAYEFLRNSALDAKNYFDKPDEKIPPLRRNQFGGMLSGPLRPNRLFFLVNYEAIREPRGETTRVVVPDRNSRQGILPSQRVAVSPLVRPYLDLFPLPNGVEFGDGTGEFIHPAVRRTREDYAAGKIDYLHSPALRMAARYTFDDGDRAAPDPLNVWRFAMTSRYQFAHGEAQRIYSPRTIQTFRAAFSRVWNLETAPVRPDIPAELAFVPGRGLGAIRVEGLTELGGTAVRQTPRLQLTNIYQLNQDLVQVRGRSTILLGAGFDRVQLNQVADLTAMGYYQFGSLADFLLARAQQADVMMPGSNTARGWRQNLFFAYVQLNYRAASRVGLGFGLRYEAYSTPEEVNGKIATLPNPDTDQAVTVGGPFFRNPSADNFAPRVSLAWDPLGQGKTVLRAGAGVFFELLGARNFLIAGVRMPPFYNRVVVRSPSFPNLLAAVASAQPESTVEGFEFRPNQPYAAQAQVAIEQQLGPDSAVRLAYVTTRGIHLPGAIGNINPTRPEYLADGRIFFPANTPRVNPAFGNIGMRRTQFDSYYHSLHASFERRWRRGFRAEARYSWGKSIDTTSTSLRKDFENSDNIPMVFNYRQNRGRSDFDLRHAASANFSYELSPAVAGLELHGLLRWQTGPPFNPFVGFDRARLLPMRGDLGQRPDYVAQPGLRVILGDPARYFNPAAFAVPAAGTYGNLGRGTLTGPGLFNLDLAIHKTLWRRERESLKLRVEGFNLTNRPNFQIPLELSLYNSRLEPVNSAGRITSTTTTSRQIQLGLRFVF